MDEKALLTWFEEIDKDFTEVRASSSGEDAVWARLFTKMATALESVFPPSHTVRRRWDAAQTRGSQEQLIRNSTHLPDRFVKDQLYGVFQTAHDLLKQGHARSLADGVRAETITQCLDQAEAFAKANYAIPAMVLAGGALETHLLNLCTRFSLTWTGEGSINKYNGALGQARNQGIQNLVTSSDTGLISSWGSDRNDAAHQPTSFIKKPDEVLHIIIGIRQFLSRTL